MCWWAGESGGRSGLSLETLQVSGRLDSGGRGETEEKTVIQRCCQLVGVNDFFIVIIGVAGTLLVGLLRSFGDSRWTEYVRCGDSRAMERCVV